MKRLLIAALILLCALPSQPSTSAQRVSPMYNKGVVSVTLDVHNGATSGVAVSSLAVTLTGVTQHDLITCEAIFAGSTTLTHIADTLNGTFSNDFGPTKQTFEQEFAVISSFVNSAAGNDTITMTVGTTTNFSSLSCQAWKNVIQTSPVDVAVAANCSNGSCSTNSGSTVANATTNTGSPGFASTDLEIGIAAFGSQTATAGSGFTLIDVDSVNAMYPEYKAGSVPTSAAWVNAADNWITGYVTYKHQ